MKIIKKIIAIVAIIMLCTLFFSSFATEETIENVIETSNNEVENTIENNTNNDNENNNEQTNTIQQQNNEGNTQQETGNQGTNNSGSESEKPKNENNNSNSGNQNKPSLVTVSAENYDNTTVESSNNNLKYLAVDAQGLSPEFSKGVTEYYLVVDLDTEKLDIQASAEDAKASVTIIGNKDLVEGENTVQIIVKAENGNTKIYTIHVTKTDDIDGTNANLKTLTIDGFNVYPKFKPNIYNYSLTINEKISQLKILAETDNAEATFEIIGNDNLKEGDNLIKIIVTAKNGEAKREYKINAYISTKSVQNQKTNRNQAVVILAVLGVAIIGISYTLYKRKQKK